MATHSSVLAWRIPGTAEPGRLPSMGLHEVGHDWSNLAAAAMCTVWMEPVHTMRYCSYIIWKRWRNFANGPDIIRWSTWKQAPLLALKGQKTIFWTAYRNGWPLRAEDLSPIATRSWIPPATWVNERGLSSRGGCFPANILVVGLWHPEQETQLDYAQTPDPQKLWDN